ncbi:hypothetical protein [Enterobacter sp. 2VL]|uniref:hypothetical protein n=1 Tax=Enterobacter sp. 2VL TaxID=2502206 RepID=UPI001485BBE2|nr:hypothetical protein [Enterobacter sp. 2VL]
MAETDFRHDKKPLPDEAAFFLVTGPLTEFDKISLNLKIMNFSLRNNNDYILSNKSES